jgi:hypothetical protein
MTHCKKIKQTKLGGNPSPINRRNNKYHKETIVPIYLFIHPRCFRDPKLNLRREDFFVLHDKSVIGPFGMA